MLRAAVDELGMRADDDALSWIAKDADGSLRDAYTLFDQVVAFCEGDITLEKIHAKLGLVGLERLNVLMSAVVEERRTDALNIVDQTLQAGISAERFAVDLADYVRTLLLYGAGIEREAVLGVRPQRIPEVVRSGWDQPRRELANEIVLQLYRDLRYTVNQRFELELVVSRLASLTSFRTPNALVRELRDLQESILRGQAPSGAADATSSEIAPDKGASTEEVSTEEGAVRVVAEPAPFETSLKEDVKKSEQPTRPAPPIDEREGAATDGSMESKEGPEGEVAEGELIGRNVAPPRARSDGQTPDLSIAPLPDEGEQRGESMENGPEEREEEPFDPGEPPQLFGVTEEEVEAVIGCFRTKRIAVAALLRRARLWRRTPKGVVIAFRDEFSATSLTGDVSDVREAIGEVLGESVPVHVHTLNELSNEGEPGSVEPPSTVDPTVEMVREIFRGEIVEE